jgi:hypothetical protein
VGLFEQPANSVFRNMLDHYQPPNFWWPLP